MKYNVALNIKSLLSLILNLNLESAVFFSYLILNILTPPYLVQIKPKYNTNAPIKVLIGGNGKHIIKIPISIIIIFISITPIESLSFEVVAAFLQDGHCRYFPEARTVPDMTFYFVIVVAAEFFL